MSSPQSTTVDPGSGPLGTSGPFGRFADALLAIELPDLPDDRRADTVSFVCRRTRQVPTPLRVGIIALALALGTSQRVLGNDRTTGLVRDTPLPFVGELPRLVRSLGFAYVWETWPATSPTGAAS